MPKAIFSDLGEDRPTSGFGSVAFKAEWSMGVRLNKYWSLRESFLEEVKCVLLRKLRVPGSSLLGEVI
jgi:hypothetical protein